MTHDAKTTFSFEVFPPKTDDGLAALTATTTELQRARPNFISVTYGAGGSQQDRSFAAVEAVDAGIQAATRTDQAPATVAAHLTCVGQSVADVEAVLDRYDALGVTRIVALRGDPPGGIDAPYVAHPSGFQRTEDLVAAIAARQRFWVSVSAYPEKHPQSPSVEHDIEVLAAKVQAGADAAMTQMFFDNDYYFAYLERVRSAGIDIPIIPGIFPIHSISGVAKFAAGCGATIPTHIFERFDSIADSADPEKARFELAVEIAAQQVLGLAADGVRHAHIYTLNKSHLALAVVDAIGQAQAHDRIDDAGPSRERSGRNNSNRYL